MISPTWLPSFLTYTQDTQRPCVDIGATNLKYSIQFGFEDSVSKERETEKRGVWRANAGIIDLRKAPGLTHTSTTIYQIGLDTQAES